MFRCFLLILVSVVLSQYPSFAQKPEILFHHLDWKATENTTLTEVRLFIRNTGWKVNTNPKVNLDLLLVDAKGDTIGRDKVVLKLPIGTPIGPETVLPYTFAQVLKSGKYNVMLNAFDAVTDETVSTKIPIQVKNLGNDSIRIAQPVFVYNYMQTNKPSLTTKSGMDLEIRPLNFFSQSEDVLQVYVEAYHPKKNFRPYWIRGGFANDRGIFYSDYAFNKKVDSAEATSILRSINIKDLPSGTYQMRFEAIDKNGKTITSSSTEFIRSNPPADNISITDNDGRTKLNLAGTFAESMKIEDLKRYIAALQPIATETEKRAIPIMLANTDVLGMRQFLLNFWKRRNANDPGEGFVDYKRRLAHAQRNYSVPAMSVFQTDRGRVLLQYGFPNQVETELNDRQRSAINNSSASIGYEIWYYYKTAKTNQNNIQFVFIQENRGNNNYRLVHSNATGEVMNTNWRTMTQGRGNVGTGNLNNQTGR